LEAGPFLLQRFATKVGRTRQKAAGYSGIYWTRSPTLDRPGAAVDLVAQAVAVDQEDPAAPLVAVLVAGLVAATTTATTLTATRLWEIHRIVRHQTPMLD